MRLSRNTLKEQNKSHLKVFKEGRRAVKMRAEEFQIEDSNVLTQILYQILYSNFVFSKRFKQIKNSKEIEFNKMNNCNLIVN